MLSLIKQKYLIFLSICEYIVDVQYVFLNKE